MHCKMFEDELMDLMMVPGARPSVAAVAHMKGCTACAEEYLGFQETFMLLNSWKAPEPTAYFDQKLAVRMREEQAAPRMGWFESLTTRLALNTGRSFRPAMVGALSFALVAGGVGIVNPFHLGTATPVQASATVNDLQILDRNEQAFQQMDELQQEEDTKGAQNPTESAPVVPPTS